MFVDESGRLIMKSSRRRSSLMVVTYDQFYVRHISLIKTQGGDTHYTIIVRSSIMYILFCTSTVSRSE